MCPVNDSAAHCSTLGAVDTASVTSPPVQHHIRNVDRRGIVSQATPYTASAMQQPRTNAPCATGLVWATIMCPGHARGASTVMR